MGVPSRQSPGAHQTRSCRAGQRHVPDLRGSCRTFSVHRAATPPHLQAPPSWNRQEDLMSAWFRQPDDDADAARRPVHPPDHPTCQGLRDRVAESATLVNLDASVGHPGCSAAILVNLSSAVDRPCRTLDVEQRQP